MTQRGKSGKPRREPRLADSAYPDLRVSPEDRARTKLRTEKPSRKTTSDRTRKTKRAPSPGFLRRAFYWSAVLGLWGFIALAGIIAYQASHLPNIDALSVPKRPPNIAILASDGSLMANRGETGGRSVAIKELPSYLPKGFVAIEDKRFYSHFGLDPVGIARALVRNVTSRGVAQGGSTLTQQLAKNLFLTQERTMSRKIQEAILAFWLERTYSKDQILELYLNRVYFGSGAYGVEAAAQKYFNKPAKAVTLSEAAILAGLVQAPSRLAPNKNPKAAQERATLVLAAMAEQGIITDRQASIALTNPAQVPAGQGAASSNYAADYVMDLLDDFIGAVENDITVQTSLDNTLQNAAEKAITEELNAKGTRFGVAQGALVSMKPDGAIVALIGGRDYSVSQFNRATAAKRQPGSAFKPFVYLAAMEAGLTPDTLRDDAPVSIKGWNPENYSREYRGKVTLREALATSLNTVAVRLGQEIGPKTVARTAQRLGITSALQANPSLALGTSEVTPLELTAAYASFANGGTGVIPYVITQVKTGEGKVLYQRRPSDLGAVMDKNTNAMMNAMMRETLLTGTARKAEMTGWESAGKTGTSQDFRDAWFVGYTATLVTGIWFGNDDNSATKKASGSTLPSETWGRFMRQALSSTKPVSLPGGGAWRRPVFEMIDPPTASLPSSSAPVSAYPSDPARENPAAILEPRPRIHPRPGPTSEARAAPPAPIANSRPAPPSRPDKTLWDDLFGGAR
jgi:penicillin-binding protein 1A